MAENKPGQAPKPALTDDELDLEGRQVELEKARTDLERERGKLKTEQDNRQLRTSIAKGALVVMAVQIIVANVIFVWYGDTNGWEVPGTAISAWLGATVVQVIVVVLVIMNYLFPKGGPKD